MTLRTEHTQRRYDDFRTRKVAGDCYLCRGETVREYRYWRILENEYPYDRIADTHHIVALKRHAPEHEMTAEERTEYERVRRDLHTRYDMLFENTVRKKSIPGHHHLHAITLRTETATKHETSRPLAALHE